MRKYDFDYKNIISRSSLMAVFMLVVLMVASLTSCKEKYVAPYESPHEAMTKADSPYDIDFVQVNNEVIDSFNDDNPYDFVNDFSVDGDNAAKTITFTADIKDGVADEALEYFISDVLKKAAIDANDQDGRLSAPTDDNFGGLYNNYAYEFKITCGSETKLDETVESGKEIPHDPSKNFYNLVDE